MSCITRLVNPRSFDRVSHLCRSYFRRIGYTECHTQGRLAALSACEDPQTMATIDFGGKDYSAIQTGQVSMEEIILRDPTYEGLFTMSTSYRAEPNPKLGRHDETFPLFEWEAPGKLEDLIDVEHGLLESIGFETDDMGNFPRITYEDACDELNVDEIDHPQEAELCRRYGRVVFLTHFPERTSPFWNMRPTYNGWSHRTGEQLYNKVDVLIDGVETIGSAERDTDVEAMRARFWASNGGTYAGALVKKFGQARVNHELEDLLSLTYFPRCGGGLGVSRLIRAINH